MCRISGIINPDLKSDELLVYIKRMCDILAHGGPDGEGIFLSKKHSAALGHRRLALLDLSESGKQPMELDNGRYQITYNGEIYNYPELKNQLEDLGHCFNSVCDTEMILIAFKEWGSEAFKKFKGMFAIALLDDEQGILYLVRDPSGIKPLYYYHNNKKLLFASEVRALEIFPELNVIDERAKILLLAYGHLPEPVTTLKEVVMLKKGSFLSFDLKSGRLLNTIYDSFSYTELLDNRKEINKLIQDKLRLAVKRHLLSDAPIGAFLSGGIDSSLIALLAHEFTGDKLKTLSLYFNEQRYSEKQYQDLIINQGNFSHGQYLLTGEEFSSLFEKVINDMDLPSTDGINTWFISKYASQFGLKAVLSGVGSDELFGGYPSFKRMPFLKILKLFAVPTFRFLKLFSKRFERICYLNIKGVTGEYLFLRGLFIPKDIALILNITEENVWSVLESTSIKTNIKELSLKNQASWLELNMYMQNQLLRDSDVMSMAHGIEIRVPFLDSDLLKNILSIQSRIKYQGAIPKQILINAFINILPERIWNRKKMGFTFPFKEWLKNNEFMESKLRMNPLYKKLYYQFSMERLPWSKIMALLVMEKKLNDRT